MSRLLEVKGISKIFKVGGILFGKKLVAVDDVSFFIDNDKPCILSIVGESGCGKSTICNMILRRFKNDAGSILLDDKDYNKKFNTLEFRQKVQPIFQNPYSTFSARKPIDTYLFNTAINLKVAKNKKEAEELADSTLKSVGMSLDNIRGKYITQFSGGELQRISIARALIPKPKLIVADEPVAAVDASLKMNIVNLFKEIKDKYGTSFLYITHDLSTAYYVSDYILTLYRGSLIEGGKTRDIMDNPSHPYTELLLSSIPRIGEKWDINMVMPDLESKEYAISHCKFAARCKYATPECFKSKPTLKSMGNGRRVACFNPINI